MKVLKTLAITISVFALSLVFIQPVSAATLSERLSGKILLQVQARGEAWYVNPLNYKRYYMGRPSDAFALMREVGLGISNAEIRNIPVAILETYGKDSDGDGLPDDMENSFGTSNLTNDSDGDTYSDKDEILNHYDPLGPGRLPIDNALINRLKGRILLQVQSHGEAWYLNPADGKRYFLGRPDDAFKIMRGLGLGITNLDLSQIDFEYKWVKYYNEKYGFEAELPLFVQLESMNYASVIFMRGPVYRSENWPWITFTDYDSGVSADTDIMKWVTDKFGTEYFNKSEIKLVEGVKIDGLKTAHIISSSLTDLESWPSADYYFVKGTHVYKIQLLHTDKKADWVLYNRFLNTFKFVTSPTVVPEPIPVPVPVLNTYTNTMYNYQLKYPAEWRVYPINNWNGNVNSIWVQFSSPNNTYTFTFGIRRKGETIEILGRRAMANISVAKADTVNIAGSNIPIYGLYVNDTISEFMIANLQEGSSQVNLDNLSYPAINSNYEIAASFMKGASLAPNLSTTLPEYQIVRSILESFQFTQ